MQEKFELQDVKDFLASKGLNWTGIAYCPGKKNDDGNITLLELTDWMFIPKLLFKGENKSKFYRGMVFLNENEFKMANEGSDKIDFDYSDDWQAFLVNRYPELAEYYKSQYENWIEQAKFSREQQIKIAGGSTPAIEKEFADICAKYEQKIANLTNGRSL